MHSRKPLRRKAPLKPRTPMPGSGPRKKPRRRPNPDREFWQEQRAVLYGRSRGLCERCGCSLDEKGLEAHHRKFRSRGGGHGVENLAALCGDCHRWVHANNDAATPLGYALPAGSNPVTRAMVLWDGRTVRLDPDGTYDECWPADDAEVAS